MEIDEIMRINLRKTNASNACTRGIGYTIENSTCSENIYRMGLFLDALFNHWLESFCKCVTKEKTDISNLSI